MQISATSSQPLNINHTQKGTSAKRPSEEYTRSMVARRPSTTHHRITTVHSLMPGLIRTRNALATRRRSSGNSGKPEPAAAPTDDSATDPLDDSTSVHRRMDLLLAKSASVEEPKSAHTTGGGLLRASTASTVPSTVVDGETPPKPAISSAEAAAPPGAENKVPEGKESRVVVMHTGESARLTPAPTPAPAPAPAKLETSNSSASSACSAVSRRRSLKSAMARTCADTTTTTTAATVTSTSTKPAKKSVHFSDLEIRTYPVTLGDNPSVSSGPPLTLDWNYTTTHTFAVETYESQRPPASRRKLPEMALPQSLRIELLCEDARISLRTIQAQCREVERCKKQRRRTVESLSSAWLCRAVKRMAPGRSSRRA